MPADPIETDPAVDCAAGAILPFSNSYARLPERFFARLAPTPVSKPRLIRFNEALAAELGFDAQGLAPDDLAAVFAGNVSPPGAEPIAMAYAGHQFGGFVPRLGDGRAILLGEIEARDGTLRDVQLKGAGLTPFSRGGDGRAVLGPMLREYIISEAMHALGVPTTRSLAVVATGERVYRDEVLPGAVLTRIASSHIRVGTFQYFAARGDREGLEQLLEYVIARHYPAARDADSPALAVLKEVTERQVALITRWMLLGFIHGVMNTDNMALSGETIDYGPCAFMDEYDPKTVFSSIDHNGRYAYTNQPAIAQWNLARLAETLVPLIDPDVDKAVTLATEVIAPFIADFDARFLEGMRRKIGLATALDGDAELIRDLLTAMHRSHADFTLTFRRLALAADPDMARWLGEWRKRLAQDPKTTAERVASMRAASPAFIPRNHRVEAALKAAEAGDCTLLHKLLGILRQPYEDQPEMIEYAQPPEPSERVLQTFCGT